MDSRQEELERLRKDMAAKAALRRLRLNPDEAMTQTVLRGLVKRRQKYGALYCPCRVVSGEPAKDKEIICPCIFCEQEVEKNGICHCRLLVPASPCAGEDVPEGAHGAGRTTGAGGGTAAG